jgi:DNA-binding IclR family transcriptional regulator
VAVQPSPAVLRACRVLEVLAEEPDEALGLSEVARRVGIPRASCQTLLMALTEHGLVLRREPELTYVLGAACLTLGTAAAAANPVVGAAAPVVQALSERTGVATVAVVRAGDQARAALVQPGADPFGTTVREGQAVPITPPFGAVFVAWRPAEERERWLATGRPAIDADARSQLRAALAEVRRRGCSVALRGPAPSQASRSMRSARDMTDIAADPTASGRRRRQRLAEALVRSGYLAATLDPSRSYPVAQISAPVFDARGDVALALMVAGPPYELSVAEIDALATELREAAAEVTARIRGVAPPLDAEAEAEAVDEAVTGRGRRRAVRTAGR